MTKKKKPVPRLRLTSYQRALQDAQQRLEKAMDERTDYLQKLDALAREIPYLEGIVTALTPLPLMNEVPTAPPWHGTPQPPPAAFSDVQPLPQPATPYTEIDQQQFLARFMPRTGRTTTVVQHAPVPQQSTGNSADPDEFLNDDGRGRDILS